MFNLFNPFKKEKSIFQELEAITHRLKEIQGLLEDKEARTITVPFMSTEYDNVIKGDAIIPTKKHHGNLGKKHNRKPTKCPCGYKAKNYRGLQIHNTKAHGKATQ